MYRLSTFRRPDLIHFAETMTKHRRKRLSPWECFGTDQRDNHRDLFGWGTKDNPNNVSGNDGDDSRAF